RDQKGDVDIKGERDRTITAIRAVNHANIGAYLATFAPGSPTIDFGLMVSCPYKTPKAQVTTYGMYTNTMSVDSYRGAGKPEVTFMLERAVSDFAKEIGMDPVEVRKLNFAQKEEFPFTNAQGLVYDSGDYDKALDRA